MEQCTPEGTGRPQEQVPSGATTARALPATLWGLLAVLVAAAVALPLADAGPRRGSDTSSARQVMREALTASMGQSTVHMTFSGSVVSAGVTVNVSGTGAADFSSKAASIHVTGTVAGQQETVTLEMVGGTAYVQLPAIAAADPGKSWLSITPGSSTGFGSSMGNLGTFGDPSAILSMLRSSGAAVTSLGASTLGGTTVQGYRVTMDAASLGAAASALGLPSGATQKVGRLQVTAYVGGNLLRSLDVTETGQASVSASIDFHGYGQPVSVQPPAATSVVPFSQFAASGALPGHASSRVA